MARIAVADFAAQANSVDDGSLAPKKNMVHESMIIHELGISHATKGYNGSTMGVEGCSCDIHMGVIWGWQYDSLAGPCSQSCSWCPNFLQ